jgi:hypothetical protein
MASFFGRATFQMYSMVWADMATGSSGVVTWLLYYVQGETG